MIFLSAQPARFYFKWQIQIQLFNFNRLGIKRDDIHVLFGYKPDEGIDDRIADFANTCTWAKFFFYEDTRPFSRYEPTIRPHIIKKHLNEYPYLQKSAIFYHDCDIIFREIPNFDLLLADDSWYLSDATSYIGVEQIKAFGSEIFDEMCAIVGVNKRELQDYGYTGGAQYLLKNVNQNFWDKVEHDSESIYNYLVLNEKRLKKRFEQESERQIPNGRNIWIQAWCSDMWALAWNGILFDFDIKIHEEFTFSWATSEIDTWSESKIFHNAGVFSEDSDELFYKGDFTDYTPFQTNLEYVNRNKCSYKYVEEIKRFIRHKREDMNDVTFVIVIAIRNVKELKKLRVIIDFITKYLKTKILVIECGKHSFFGMEFENDEEVSYVFCEHEENISISWSNVNNIIYNELDTTIFFLYIGLVLIDIEKIKETVNFFRNEEYDIVSPYNGTIVSITEEQAYNKFKNKLDISLFEKYDSRAKTTLKSFDGCVVVKKELLVTRSNGNNYIVDFSLCSLEGISRAIILGGRFKRTEGKLYCIG